MTALQLLAGLAFLTAGGEALVRGASRLARLFGISPLVIGLTVVAFGTSTPELVVSLYASHRGNPDIAVANVVGSNIFNVLFILGLCAIIRALVVAPQILRQDVPLLIALSLTLWVMALDGKIELLEGLLLLALFTAYLIFVIRQSRRESRAVQEEYDEAYGSDGKQDTVTRSRWPLQLGWVILGLALLMLGARWLVEAAITIARSAGLSEAVIGLTIVAAGTSLPEVSASVIATLRGERDIAVGNVIGSNLFNIFVIIGVSALLPAGGLVVHPGMVRFDLPVMVATAAACLPLFFTGRVIARWEGVLFLGLYAAYTAYLILDSQEHDALPAYSRTMLLFVLPLIAVTIVASSVRALHAERRGSTSRRA